MQMLQFLNQAIGLAFGITASENTGSSQPQRTLFVRINVCGRIQLIWGQERTEGEKEEEKEEKKEGRGGGEEGG